MRSDEISSKIPPRERPPTVTHQVAEHLARLIATGRLVPGERLPGEAVLARRLGISRPTLRDALGTLRDRGLLEIRPRSGTYVRSPAPEGGAETLEGLLRLEPGDLWELLEIRKITDPAGAALAARRRTVADLAEMEELLGSAGGLRGERLLTWRHAAGVYGRFFSLLAVATHNRLFSRLAEGLAGMLRDALAYGRLQLAARPEAGEVIRGQLGRIFEAVAAGDAETARRATLRHLEYVEETLREIEGEGGEG